LESGVKTRGFEELDWLRLAFRLGLGFVKLDKESDWVEKVSDGVASILPADNK
jgi:hypothetical protein